MQIIICYMNCSSMLLAHHIFPLQMINCEIYSLMELVLFFDECVGNERHVMKDMIHLQYNSG